MKDPQVLTSREIAETLDLPESRIVKWIQKKELGTRRSDGSYQVAAADWRAAIRERLFKPWSAAKTHDRALDLLKDEKRGKLLDVGAGAGAISHQLQELGFEVSACDRAPAFFCLDRIRCARVDLNQGLSVYPTDSFDYVVCLDVLEHVENHFLVLREIGRVLKPGGLCVFSTPNIDHLQSRLLFLFARTFPGFKAEDFSLGHINPVYPVFFSKMLVKTGFHPKQVTYNRGWIYTSLAKKSLLKENGLEIPIRNRLLGQITIIVAERRQDCA